MREVLRIKKSPSRHKATTSISVPWPTPGVCITTLGLRRPWVPKTLGQTLQ